MYVTKLELWNDTEFVENSAEYPSLSDTLTNPNFTYTDLHPAKEDLFSYFKIKGVSYETLISVSYARVTYDNLSYPVYMWVDSVACISDTSTKLTAVSCHVDLWRTYLGDARLGYGLVTKRIRGTADPIQSCPYRYRLAGDYVPFSSSVTGSESYWVMINMTYEYNNNKVTNRRVMCIPIDREGVATRYLSTDGTTDNTWQCCTIQDFINGSFEEKLNLSASQISSVVISPYPPLYVKSGKGTDEEPYVIETKVETDDDSMTFSGRVDFKRVINISYYVGSGGYTNPQSTVTVYYSDSNPETSNKIVAAGIPAQIVSMGFAKAGGYGKSYTYPYDGKVIKQTVDGVEFPYTMIPLDSLVTVEGITIPDAAVLTLDNIHGIYGSASWSVSNYEAKLTLGTKTEVTSFTRKDGSWGSYWVACDPDNLPNYKVTIGDISSLTVQGIDTVTPEGKSDKYAYCFSSNDRYQEISGSCDLMTTDTSEVVMLDFQGNPIMTMPWGLHRLNYSIRPILTATAGYLEIRFDDFNSKVNGTSVVIPLPQVDVTSNSWTDYVLSGQREYDIEQRKIASQQALVSGITGGVQSSVSTGVMGTIGEMKDKGSTTNGVKFKPINILSGKPVYESETINMPGEAWSLAKKAGVTGGAMAAASIGGALVDYAAAQYFNGKLQGIEDTLQAKQIDSIITAGSGWDWLYYGRMPGFVTLVPDDYSLINFQNNIQYNGITCSEPTADCSAYKDYLGPIQIQNLIVTGNIPLQAKYFIANTYAKGIRMKCLNARPPYDATISTFTETSVLAGTYVLYNDTDYKYKINCVANDEIREQYIVEAGDNVTVTLVAGDVISTLYYDKMWIANPNTVNVL